ncbi:hypothetical protein E2C01_096016 [Portunus trituberculatus]|uniref:Uncharacterized protein n=1 Tax=Portunus trituberculatus TaxID=210409 RepID=A0A5B7K0Q7_PORTR|nr:hypothetical protein [Portunus trituberculatus]
MTSSGAMQLFVNIFSSLVESGDTRFLLDAMCCADFAVELNLIGRNDDGPLAEKKAKEVRSEEQSGYVRKRER